MQFNNDMLNNYYFFHGVNLGINCVVILWILSSMFNWCSDPLADKLRKKIDKLDEDNTALSHEIDELNAEIEHLRAKRRRCSDTADASTGTWTYVLNKDGTIDKSDGESSIDDRLKKVD